MSQVSDNFLSLYYDSIGPVPFTTMQEDGNIMRYSTYEYPHRALQDAIPQEYDKLIVSGELAFINGLEDYLNLWPDLFLRFRARLRRPELAHLQHPLYGEVWGFFSQWRVQYNVRELNGCRVSFVFEEVSEDARVRPDALRNDIAKAISYGQVADAGLQMLASPGVTLFLNTVPPPSLQITRFQATYSLANQATAFAAYIEGADLIATAIQQQADQILGIASIALAAPELQLPVNYQVRNAIVQYQSAIQAAADTAKATAGQIVFLAPLPFPLSALEIAQRLYADPTKAVSIYQLNPISMFEYPRGEVLRVPSLDYIHPSTIQKRQTSIPFGPTLQIPGSGLSVQLPLGTR